MIEYISIHLHRERNSKREREQEEEKRLKIIADKKEYEEILRRYVVMLRRLFLLPPSRQS